MHEIKIPCHECNGPLSFLRDAHTRDSLITGRGRQISPPPFPSGSDLYGNDSPHNMHIYIS